MPKVRYSEKDLQEAIRIYKEGLNSGQKISYNKLGERFNIPGGTIRSRITKPPKYPILPPKQKVLTPEMESELTYWIHNDILQNQIYCSREFIRQNAEYIYKREFPNGKITLDDINFFFEDNSYLKRRLSEQNRIRLGQSELDYIEKLEKFLEPRYSFRDKPRRGVNMNGFVNRWHLRLIDWIIENEIPENRIYNLDETCFDLNPGLHKLQTKYIDEEEFSKSRYTKWDLLSTIMIISLSGEILPPVIIYKGEELNLNWIKNNPKNWLYGVTNTGWITPELIMGLFKDYFLKALDAGKDRPPIGLVLNGNISHKTIEFQNFCELNNIKLHYVPTPSRNLKQPIKNLIEKKIKPQWKGLTKPINIESAPSFVNLKIQFNYNYKLALEKLTPKIIQNAWEKSGLSMKCLKKTLDEDFVSQVFS
ncbi:uncharacterized protein KGF55_005476 [Candida pseudojiufengensis]|uniref:uncharacterized protein n=1 Tax=Candida pseudojiufengensis TaxID=497109 RepID=UPI0022257FB2|nr:uncharacterized protein KGF55_005476 [Candida pseudojiufengensis]KAI5959133.1 hypothetical protein KGF55_005476 [Candida pseudojiufengensis]